MLGVRAARRLPRVWALPRRPLSRGRSRHDQHVNALEEAEFQGLVESVGRRLKKTHPIKASTIATEADADGDGVVTQAELAAWWKRRATSLLAVSAATAAGPPTRKQLLRLGLVAAVPCFTFGFLDNAIMLVAGEAIEGTLGVKFGLSAMACAAMGNIIADTTGQVSGGTVDNVLRPYLPAPNLSASQRLSRDAGITHAVGGALGIFLGCCVGSFPLLFYQERPKDCCDDDHRAPPLDAA
jgi:hypothetical protein